MLEERLGNRPCGGKYGDIVQAIGHTPLVELKRLSPKPGVRLLRQARELQPDRFGQGPRGAGADRGRRGARGDPAGPDDPRAHLRQHRHLAGDDLLAQGLSAQGRDARQRHRVERTTAAADVRRGDRLLTGRAGLQRRGRDGARHGRGRLPPTTCPTSTATRPIPTPTTTAPRSRSSRSWIRSTCSSPG